MKKLNKKGFTLIELLAVVVILLAISVIAVSSISAAIERNKAKQNESKKEIIISYAKLYYEEHKNDSNIASCIDLHTLKDGLKLSDSELQDADGKNFKGVITHTNGRNFQFDKSRNSC